MEKAKIPNISHFKPESTGLRAWEFQGIGTGKHIPYQPLNFHPSSDVLVPFQDAESSKKSDTLMKTKSRKSTAKLFCHDRECVEVFSTEKELDAHLNIGKHSYSTQADNRCTTDDKVRILFAKKVKRSILLTVMPQRITHEHEKKPCAEKIQRDQKETPRKRVIIVGLKRKVTKWDGFSGKEENRSSLVNLNQSSCLTCTIKEKDLEKRKIQQVL